MEKQINIRLIDTENGQLLVRKCIVDENLGIKFSCIHDTGDFYVEPSLTMAFDDETKQTDAFNVDDETANDFYNSLMEAVRDSLEQKEEE